MTSFSNQAQVQNLGSGALSLRGDTSWGDFLDGLGRGAKTVSMATGAMKDLQEYDKQAAIDANVAKLGDVAQQTPEAQASLHGGLAEAQGALGNAGDDLARKDASTRVAGYQAALSQGGKAGYNFNGKQFATEGEANQARLGAVGQANIQGGNVKDGLGMVTAAKTLEKDDLDAKDIAAIKTFKADPKNFGDQKFDPNNINHVSLLLKTHAQRYADRGDMKGFADTLSHAGTLQAQHVARNTAEIEALGKKAHQLGKMGDYSMAGELATKHFGDNMTHSFKAVDGDKVEWSKAPISGGTPVVTTVPKKQVDDVLFEISKDPKSLIAYQRSEMESAVRAAIADKKIVSSENIADAGNRTKIAVANLAAKHGGKADTWSKKLETYQRAYPDAELSDVLTMMNTNAGKAASDGISIDKWLANPMNGAPPEEGKAAAGRLADRAKNKPSNPPAAATAAGKSGPGTDLGPATSNGKPLAEGATGKKGGVPFKVINGKLIRQ